MPQNIPTLELQSKGEEKNLRKPSLNKVSSAIPGTKNVITIHRIASLFGDWNYFLCPLPKHPLSPSKACL